MLHIVLLYRCMFGFQGKQGASVFQKEYQPYQYLLPNQTNLTCCKHLVVQGLLLHLNQRQRILQSLQDQVKSLDETRAVQLHDIGVLQGRLRIMGMQIDEINELWVAEKKRATDALSELDTSRALLASYETEVHSLRHGQPEVNQLREANRELNHRIVEMGRRFDHLEAVLPIAEANAQQEAERARDLQEQLTRLRRTMAEERDAFEVELQALRDAHGQELSDVSSTQQDVHGLQREVADLREQLKLSREDATRDHAALAAELTSRHATQMSELQKECNHVSTQLRACEAKIETLLAAAARPTAAQAELRTLQVRSSPPLFPPPTCATLLLLFCVLCRIVA